MNRPASDVAKDLEALLKAEEPTIRRLLDEINGKAQTLAQLADSTLHQAQANQRRKGRETTISLEPLDSVFSKLWSLVAEYDARILWVQAVREALTGERDKK